MRCRTTTLTQELNGEKWDVELRHLFAFGWAMVSCPVLGSYCIQQIEMMVIQSLGSKPRQTADRDRNVYVHRRKPFWATCCSQWVSSELRRSDCLQELSVAVHKTHPPATWLSWSCPSARASGQLRAPCERRSWSLPDEHTGKQTCTTFTTACIITPSLSAPSQVSLFLFSICLPASVL